MIAAGAVSILEVTMVLGTTTLLLVGLGMIGGCGSSSAPPADVNGTYTLNLTNGENECMFMGWTEGGTTAAGVTISLAQDTANPSQVTGSVQGVAGLLVSALYGSTNFSGTVVGSTVAMTLEGNKPGSSGNCAYTLVAHLTALASGDNINGTIKHTLKTNMTSDCGYRNACANTQTFAGARPPK
jgi:hypothetical protein